MILLHLRLHYGRWIFTKNAVQIEKTEINILQKECRKKLLFFFAFIKLTIMVEGTRAH